MTKYKIGAIILSFVLVFTAITFTPNANAASSSEIKNQITQLKKEKDEITAKIKDLQLQYEETEDEIADIVAKKIIIDNELQLLSEQISNINDQIMTYNLLIAEKQDELDMANDRYESLKKRNKLRIRVMEESGSISYWQIIFRAKSFSDLLDRINMTQEIVAADNRMLKELSEAARQVELAKLELVAEKSELDNVKQELDDALIRVEEKRKEADRLIQELLSKSEDIVALKAEFEAKESEFLNEIAAKEDEYDEAKKAEWEAYMATYVPPTTAPIKKPEANNNSNNNNGNNTGSSLPPSNTSWVAPCSYRCISSPFGLRKAPTAGASTYHQGVDLAGATGTPVVASRSGIVAISGYSSSAGNYVKINHQDGFSSVYMHLDSRSVVTGQIVGQGQQIGTLGNTGISTGPHLHFGISLNGVYVNPCLYVRL